MLRHGCDDIGRNTTTVDVSDLRKLIRHQPELDLKYELRFKPKAVKDLAGLPLRDQERLLRRIEELIVDLRGDVRRLTDFSPEFRLRVGDYRVLFELEDDKIIIYRVRHRRESYR